MSFAAVEELIEDTFKNWDLSNEENVKKIFLSFQKFAEVIKNTDCLSNLIISSTVSSLFALFPSNETMISHCKEELFKNIYSQAVNAVHSISSRLSSGDVKDCLIKNLSFIGNLFFLHDMFKPSKIVSTQLNRIIYCCNDSVMNEYSYCALINFVGVETFVEIVRKGENGYDLYLLYKLLPLLRKTSYTPSLSLAEKIAVLLKNKYGVVEVQTVPPVSILQQLTIKDVKNDAAEDAKRFRKGLKKKDRSVRSQREYIDSSIYEVGILFGLVFGMAGGLISFLIGIPYMGPFSTVLVLGSTIGAVMKWGWDCRKLKRENMMRDEQRYYGMKGWAVRERGRSVQERKLLEKGQE